MNILKLFRKKIIICCPRFDGKPEWTPWERKTKEIERLRMDDDEIYDENITVIKYTKIYQERCCATCGKIFQEPLEF